MAKIETYPAILNSAISTSDQIIVNDASGPNTTKNMTFLEIDKRYVVTSGNSNVTGNVTVVGTVTATTLLGDGSGLTGIASGTGGVINTGSTTIGADSDADGTGVIAFQTRGVTRGGFENLGPFYVGGAGVDGVIYGYNSTSTLNVLLDSNGDSYLLGGKFGVGKTPSSVVDILGKSGVNGLDVSDRNGVSAVSVNEFGNLQCTYSIVSSTGNISTSSTGTGFSFDQGSTLGLFTIAPGVTAGSLVLNTTGLGIGKTASSVVDIRGKSGVNGLDVSDRNGVSAVSVNEFGNLQCTYSIVSSTGNISTSSTGTGFSFDQGATTGIFTIASGVAAGSLVLNTTGLGIGKTASDGILDINLTTEDFAVVDAGSTSATEQDWIEVKVGGNTGYIRVFAAK